MVGTARACLSETRMTDIQLLDKTEVWLHGITLDDADLRATLPRQNHAQHGVQSH